MTVNICFEVIEGFKALFGLKKTQAFEFHPFDLGHRIVLANGMV